MKASKPSYLKKSIVIRTGSALVGIALTALLSMFASMMVAETIEGDAQAINLSGSMRMQSYRITNAAILQAPLEARKSLINEFDSKLYSPLFDHIIHTSDNTDLTRRLISIRSRWEALEPKLLHGDIPANQLTTIIDDFVSDIDSFVSALQSSSESKIRLLRALQGVTAFIVILVSFIVLYNINQNIAIPLKDLVAAAERIRSGDFKVKSHHQSDDELGLLANTFNSMANELDVFYQKLEDRVEEKTRLLRRSNHSLRLLYNSTRRLYNSPNDLAKSTQPILKELSDLINLGTISLCLSKSDKGSAYRIITSNNNDKPSFCQAPHCDLCRHNPDKADYAPNLQEVVSFSIGKGKNYCGEITLEVLKGQRVEDWQRDLLNAVADVIYTTRSLTDLAEQEARIALMEERTVIARELHDSLAQSLSYQKLQAARLKRLLEKGADKDILYTTIQQVQDGLNASYKQLRELLGTFRIKIDAPGLEPALIGTVAEFKERSDCDIQLDYQLRDCPLTPNEEIHCLQIVREALSNVVKHAHASYAKVNLSQTPNDRISITIRDNGVGIPDLPHKNNHYGLSILSERTESLAGNIEITRHPDGGTLVSLEFLPAFMTSPNHNLVTNTVN